MNNIPERLKRLRGEISKIDFSKILGIHINTYYNYEKGTRTPDNDFINKVCTSLGISHHWLSTGTGPVIGHNTGMEADFHVFLSKKAARLIEIRGSDSSKTKAVTYLVIMKNGQVEYHPGSLNYDRRQRALEILRIRDSFLCAGCQCSSIDGSKTYISDNKEMANLFHGLNKVLLQGSDFLEEISRYADSTNTKLLPLSRLDDFPESFGPFPDDVEHLSTPSHAKNTKTYLPETTALAEAIDRLLRDQNQFRRSELTLLFLNFLKEHGLTEESAHKSKP